jgi:hypothetical protein
MRRYSRDDEERVRAQAQIDGWARTQLLSTDQAARLGADVSTDLKRTTNLLRCGLALFTALIVAAAALLVGNLLGARSDGAFAVIAIAVAIPCFLLAEVMAGAFRFYRHGLEEASAACAVLLLSVAAAEAVRALGVPWWSHHMLVAALAVGCIGGLGVFARFGFVYAAVAALVCAANIPFHLSVSRPAQHVLAAGMMAVAFVFTRGRHQTDGDDYPGDDYATLQAAAWAVMYLTLNLHVWDVMQPFFAPQSAADAPFYWMSYAAIWLIPTIGLWLGIRQRDRELLDVNIVLALVTLLTNKPYLGWPRREWDPIMLGVLLMGGAIVLRRWLARGSAGARAGFTSAQLLAGDTSKLSTIATASAAFDPRTTPSAAAPDSGFRGGASGGGGGGASF